MIKIKRVIGLILAVILCLPTIAVTPAQAAGVPSVPEKNQLKISNIDGSTTLTDIMVRYAGFTPSGRSTVSLPFGIDYRYRRHSGYPAQRCKGCGYEFSSAYNIYLPGPDYKDFACVSNTKSNYVVNRRNYDTAYVQRVDGSTLFNATAILFGHQTYSEPERGYTLIESIETETKTCPVSSCGVSNSVKGWVSGAGGWKYRWSTDVHNVGGTIDNIRLQSDAPVAIEGASVSL